MQINQHQDIHVSYDLQIQPSPLHRPWALTRKAPNGQLVPGVMARSGRIISATIQVGAEESAQRELFSLLQYQMAKHSLSGGVTRTGLPSPPPTPPSLLLRQDPIITTLPPTPLSPAYEHQVERDQVLLLTRVPVPKLSGMECRVSAVHNSLQGAQPAQSTLGQHRIQEH